MPPLVAAVSPLVCHCQKIQLPRIGGDWSGPGSRCRAEFAVPGTFDRHQAPLIATPGTFERHTPRKVLTQAASAIDFAAQGAWHLVCSLIASVLQTLRCGTGPENRARKQFTWAWLLMLWKVPDLCIWISCNTAECRPHAAEGVDTSRFCY